ncbi:uncharacterized protein LOC131435165 [Malaya genurostris]|uniref:uncharacterized protein LOC131435165 n=1 Tax=Malaya genurostris TaxID=325434 RepID=UPI0026F3BE1F|nr:uncharacterized protein LOC131435165 [Malaya genurostris]
MMLAKQLIESIIFRHRKLKNHPITLEEKYEFIQQINKHLPNDSFVPLDKFATQYEINLKNSTYQITMKSMIISKESYEIFKVISIPDIKNRTRIFIDPPKIAIHQHYKYFYPSANIKQLNKSHFLHDRTTIQTAMTCILAAIFHQHPIGKCPTTNLPTYYTEVVSLSRSNTILYIAEDPSAITIRCGTELKGVTHPMAIVVLDPDCELRIKYSMTHASIGGTSLERKIFFKSQKEMPSSTINLLEPMETSEEPLTTHESPNQQQKTSKNDHSSIYNLTAILAIISTVLIAAIVISMIYYKKSSRRRPITK